MKSNKSRWITLNSSECNFLFEELLREVRNKLNGYGDADISLENQVVQFKGSIEEDNLVVNLVDSSGNVVSKIELYLIPDVDKKGNDIETVDVYLDDKEEEGLSVDDAEAVFNDWFDSILDEANLRDEEDVRIWWENGSNVPLTLSLIYKQIVSCMSPIAKKVSAKAIRKFYDRYPKSKEYIGERIIDSALTRVINYFQKKGFNISNREHNGEPYVFVESTPCFTADYTSGYYGGDYEALIKRIFKYPNSSLTDLIKYEADKLKKLEGHIVRDSFAGVLIPGFATCFAGGKSNKYKGAYVALYAPDDTIIDCQPILEKELKALGYEILEIEEYDPCMESAGFESDLRRYRVHFKYPFQK